MRFRFTDKNMTEVVFQVIITIIIIIIIIIVMIFPGQEENGDEESARTECRGSGQQTRQLGGYWRARGHCHHT